MPSRQAQIARVGKRKVELSNLEKVLYPGDGITKAELIQYYFALAPTLLAHAKGRPLSLVRYPDGIGGESFYQKNRPDWAPDWLEYVVLGEEKKNYVLATEEASLVWLANLACIELHQMHSRAPHFDAPDYIVYDFDPPEGYPFPRVAELALQFKAHLEGLGYHPFVKTTGRKGLHVVTPIEPKSGFAEVFETAKTVAQSFVAAHGATVTLQLKKEQRGGKVLLDIYRNRASQSIIAAYSVRGLAGAPVSTPLSWEELPGLASSGEFNLGNVPQRLRERGDPWEALAAYATALTPLARHTRRKKDALRAAHPQPDTNNGAVKIPSPASDPKAPKHKTPGQLETYAKKRSFARTPEPPPSALAGQGNAFVVHRHHASRLHYDLRLEQNGILKSWAVPKGLPPRPGIMRLAVNVEDHPLAYADFEGAIPKAEYGGGMMWKFARGRYEITKEKKDGFYFRLQSTELNAEYRTHRTKENQWLLERVDVPQIDWVRTTIEPMLARPADDLPHGPKDFLYEVKWDGLRALISLDEGSLTIRGRSGRDLTPLFPELLVPDEAFRATSAVFDAEIVCLDATGKPVFTDVIHRMQQRGGAAVARARGRTPAVCYLFDCLYLDGRPIMSEPLERRREWLRDVVKANAAYRLSEAMEDGAGLLEAVRRMGLEGIVAKQRRSPYEPGRRSGAWLKLKTRQTAECIVIGYTRGQGDRAGAFGALHLAEAGDGGLRYVGKVGSGFDDRSLRVVTSALKKAETGPRPVREKPLDDARSVWLKPTLPCEVHYASRTPHGALREPVFCRLRPDLIP